MFEYGIGGTERKSDNASEAFADIQQNRTLFVQKLTNDEPFTPQIVPGLTTVDEVFNHFKPSVEAEFETEEGGNVKENLSFRNLGDFGGKGITSQSKFLQDLNVKQDQHLKFIRNLKQSKPLRAVLEDKEAKQAYINALHAMIKELEDAGA